MILQTFFSIPQLRKVDSCSSSFFSCCDTIFSDPKSIEKGLKSQKILTIDSVISGVPQKKFRKIRFFLLFFSPPPKKKKKRPKKKKKKKKSNCWWGSWREYPKKISEKSDFFFIFFPPKFVFDHKKNFSKFFLLPFFFGPYVLTTHEIKCVISHFGH